MARSELREHPQIKSKSTVWCGMVCLVWFDRLKRDMQQQGVFTVASNVYDMKHMFFQGIVAMIAFHHILQWKFCIDWNQAFL